MNVLSVEEIKQYQMEMLEYLDRVCRENSLTYSLSFGSLLGAIRHQGYIPWDDDVDIILPYYDYVKLLELLKKDGKYDVAIPGETKNYWLCYSKILHKDTYTLFEYAYKTWGKGGVFIDIFPMSYYSSDKKEREKHIARMLRYEKRMLVSYEKGLMAFRKTNGTLKSLVRIPYVIFCKVMGGGYWHKRIQKKMQTPEDIGEYIGWFAIGAKKIWSKEAVKETGARKFEGLELQCFKNYDYILTTLYKDYMRLPPESERVFPHNKEKMYRYER